jgi:hypothetical protein
MLFQLKFSQGGAPSSGCGGVVPILVGHNWRLMKVRIVNQLLQHEVGHIGT